MSEERTGRELEPRRPETGGVTPREADRSPREHGESSLERFYAGEGAHTVGLTEERAAQVVRQSGNARNIAFLATLVVVLFVPLYWFYDVGVPALAGTSRLEKEAQAQLVTDVARGHELYLANCAQCHGDEGQGGVGPALNDQAKLYNAVTPAGLPGTGHLNPEYLETVLEVGGRVVCGDPNSLMPVWSDENGGPLNYRQIEELIAFLTASNEVTWTYAPDHAEAGETLPPPTEQRGWRDPNYRPPPEASPVPACWRDPDGVQIGGSNDDAGGGDESAAVIESPGTAESPRTIHVIETATLEITDENGEPIERITVQEGETILFEVENTAGFAHNFYIGEPEKLEANQVAGLPGVPEFTEGVQEFTYEVTEAGTLEFACTVPGHYDPMHGALEIVPAASGGGQGGDTEGTPGASPQEGAEGSPGSRPEASGEASPEASGESGQGEQENGG